MGRAASAAVCSHDVPERELEVGLGDALVRLERADAPVGGALADLPVPLGSTRRNVLSPACRSIRARLDVHAVRVQVGGVRSVRHVRGAGEAARVHERGGNVVQQLVEVLEHPCRRGREQFPWAFEMAQRAALRSSGGISNGSGVGPFGTCP